MQAHLYSGATERTGIYLSRMRRRFNPVTPYKLNRLLCCLSETSEMPDRLLRCQPTPRGGFVGLGVRNCLVMLLQWKLSQRSGS
jgi:hypothetical protein